MFVMCQVACSRPAITTDDDSCIPNTYHACSCEDGRTGIRQCTASGATSGRCDCDSDAAAHLPLATRDGAGSAAQAGGRAQASSGIPQNAASAGQGASRGNAAGAGDSSDAGGVDDAPATPAADGGTITIQSPTDEATYIFDQAELRTYNIIVAPADLARIDAMPAAEQLVPAMLEFEGQTYGPYGVRYKGGQGSFMYPCTMNGQTGAKAGKCSIKLDFNDTDPEARFYGLKKLNFHSMNADTSMLRDRLGYQLYHEMGIATPRAVHAKVLVNGQLEGLFMAVEQIDSRFSRAHFSEGGKGNVYKEIWPMHDTAAPYMDALETNKDDMPSVQAMLDFRAAIASSGAAAESFFDRDYTMRYLAVDRVIMNDDGVLHFWCNERTGQGGNPGAFGNHNYYWYQEAAAPRFWLIPWDLDLTFDVNPAVRLDLEWTASATCSCRNHSVAGMDYPASCDPLVAELIGWQSEYEQKVDEFLAGPLRKQHVDTLLNTWSEQIRPAVTEAAGVNLAPDTAGWSSAVDALIEKIDGARANRGYAY
jgi:hypothetical protein